MRSPAGEFVMDCGAELSGGGVRFRLWAPQRRRVDLVLEDGSGREIELEADESGYYGTFVPGLGAGALYRYRLDGGACYPDPRSRCQPQGPHGPSMVVDPSSFRWSDASWRGIRMPGQVLYELHVGTFTSEGTFSAAAGKLAGLRELGITALELMPVAECAGGRNWGYDGVDLFAPYHVYGAPDDFKAFVDAAHAEGIGVILDVVYNHLGPDGCYLQMFNEDYFTDRYRTDWGRAINYDGPGAGGVREFFRDNARYWIAEYHIDGLRIDATQNIYDRSPEHILAEIARAARAAAGERSIVVIGENEPQDILCLQAPGEGGYGFDALWNDDFHHAARVALTGQKEAYFVDYRGSPQEFISLVKRCFLYQGQYYRWQKILRGTPVTGEQAAAFVVFLQNHDQIANHLEGRRIRETADSFCARALTALLLLAPQTPMLFMGQEYGEREPFYYFSDMPELNETVYEGRKRFIAQFDSYAAPEVIARVPDPGAEETFRRSKLRRAGGPEEERAWLLHRDLLALRRGDPVVRRQDRSAVDGAVLSSEAFVLRYFGEDEGDRLLVINLGRTLRYSPVAEPLLAAPRGRGWELVWSSDDPRYGGKGRCERYNPYAWELPSATALFFAGR